jgi:hypothetical protein
VDGKNGVRVKFGPTLPAYPRRAAPRYQLTSDEGSYLGLSCVAIDLFLPYPEGEGKNRLTGQAQPIDGISMGANDALHLLLLDPKCQT